MIRPPDVVEFGTSYIGAILLGLTVGIVLMFAQGALIYWGGWLLLWFVKQLVRFAEWLLRRWQRLVAR